MREVWPLEAKGLAALPPQVMRRGRATLLQRQPRQHQAHLAVRLMAKRRRLHNPPSDPHAPKPVHRQTRDLQDQGDHCPRIFRLTHPWLGDNTNFCSTASPTGRVGRKRGSARKAPRRSADDTFCAGAVLATKRRIEESTSSISAPSLSSLIPSPQMPSALQSCCRSHPHCGAEHFDHSKIVNYICIYLIIYSARKSNGNVKNSADAAAATRDTSGRM